MGEGVLREFSDFLFVLAPQSPQCQGVEMQPTKMHVMLDYNVYPISESDPEFSFLDTRERQTEFALLRTLGSTGGQLRGIVWFNLFLIVVCGVVMGTWVGQLIGVSILPLMEVAEEGSRITPPMAFVAFGMVMSHDVLGWVELDVQGHTIPGR